MLSKAFFLSFFHKYKPFFIGTVLVILGVIIILAISYFFRQNEPLIKTGGVALEEAGKRSDSKSDFWWLNSGGLAYMDDNVISTIQGDLEKNSKWKKKYAKNNSRDTEDGYQPQNIFRLVTRQKWQNFTQSLYFKIEKINLSDSEYRNNSNGVLFFNRYQDGDNLYYTGLRVDGDAVIKKKIDGKYYTMAETHIYSDSKKYDREKEPNFLPLQKWVGIKSELVNSSDETVDIKLYIDKNGDGKWQMILEMTDRTDKFGQAPFLESGYGGIRSDFMDVIFRDYNISEL